jgi:hypothetical protein
MAEEVFEVDAENLPGRAGMLARGENFTMLGAASGTADTKLSDEAKVSDKDIAALVNPPPGAAPDTEAITRDLAGITRSEINARTRLLTGMFERSEDDLSRARHALNAEGVGPGELKPWNAAEESRKHEYNPIEAFGSVGSVFATIASAFTRRPMINALNASAAAMEATREAKKEDYTRAYTAWKDNNELVIKRHNMMHQNYQDAIDLMSSDMRLGVAKLSALATQFGDQKTLTLLEHGMSKELFEMLDARARATDRLAEVNDKALERSRKDFDLNERLHQEGVTKQDIPRIVREWHRDWETQGYRGTDDQLLQDFRRDWAAAHDGKPPPAEEEAKFLQSVPHGRYGAGGAGGGNINLTNERQIAAAVAKKTDELRAEKTDDGKPKYTEDEVQKQISVYRRQLREDSAPLTASRADDLRGAIGGLHRASDKIDAIEKLMVKYGMITGLGGHIRRPAETIINILGGDTTAAKEFQADIATLQQWVSQRIDNKITAGRPLSAAEIRIRDIVPGLKLGDTVQFTAKQLRKLQKDINDMIIEDEARLNKELPARARTESKDDETPAWKRGIPQ